MRCTHEVKRWYRPAPTKCGRRFKRMNERLLSEGVVWKVQRCRAGHETRVFVRGVHLEIDIPTKVEDQVILVDGTPIRPWQQALFHELRHRRRAKP